MDSYPGDDVDEAAGSGFGNGRGALNDSRGSAAREVSADVPAREAGRRSRVVEEHRLHRVDYAFSPPFWYPRLEVRWSETRLPSPPHVIPRDVSSASSSGCPRVADRSQDGNPGQSTTLNDGALSAPSANVKVVRKQVRHSVVQTDPPPKARSHIT